MSEDQYSDYYAEDLDRRVNKQMAEMFADSEQESRSHESKSGDEEKPMI